MGIAKDPVRFSGNMRSWEDALLVPGVAETNDFLGPLWV